MHITVYPTAAAILTEELTGKAAVVIDVLRATSTIVTALGNGAAALVPVLSPEEGFAAVAADPEAGHVLGGERHSVRIAGFQLGNSPLEYTPDTVAEKVVIFTTTNGTRAIRRAEAAAPVYIVSFLNVSAVAEALRELGRDVAICCAGTHDHFSLEDTACAGALVDALAGPEAVADLDDLARVAREVFLQYRDRLAELLHLSRHGQNLLSLGLKEDLLYCSRLNSLPLVPIYHDGVVTLVD